jgi:hypothetical protein
VSASGVLSGTPSAAGLFELSVRCTDAAGTTAEQGLALAVQPARPPVIITPSPLQAATMGTPCLRPVAASGGKPPYSWSVSKGTLPPGLNINPLTGLIAGTPTTPATYTFSIQCMGSNGLHSETEFSLTVIPPTPPPAKSMSIPLWGQGLTYTGCRPYVYTFTAMQHGHLQSIELPADNTTLNLPYINLVRYQKSSDDCRNPDAALTLARGQSTSDMKALFNVDNPLFAQAVHIVAWLPATGPQVASVSVIITYTD